MISCYLSQSSSPQSISFLATNYPDHTGTHQFEDATIRSGIPTKPIKPQNHLSHIINSSRYFLCAFINPGRNEAWPLFSRQSLLVAADKLVHSWEMPPYLNPPLAKNPPLLTTAHFQLPLSIHLTWGHLLFILCIFYL